MANHSLPLTSVQLGDDFFTGYQRLVRSEVIPYQWNALNDLIDGAEPSGCINNFKIAAGEASGEFVGMVFQDSDLAKWLEAAAYSLANHPDEALERQCDEVIALMGRAQQDDGYLNTYFIVKEPHNRWKNIRDCHELYCAGHFLEAAIAYFQATGKRQLLDILTRYIELIAQVFGPGKDQLHAYPGHEEIELALLKLYELTGEEKHLSLAKFFIDERGKQPNYFVSELKNQEDVFRFENNDSYGLKYFQAHLPVREQKDAVGHSVRGVYLYSAMADLARLTDDQSLKDACEALFESIAKKRMYVTGAIGSTHVGEAFTYDYDLPGDTAYAETCASIGLVFFMQRMLKMNADTKYADVMERALYNSVLSGMDLDGKRFFYVNPLEVSPEGSAMDPGKRHVKPTRQKWFTCACCPPNIARLLASINEYIYLADDTGVYVNLFIGSKAKLSVAGQSIGLSMETQMPFSGDVRIQLQGSGRFALRLRKPSWCEQYSLLVNGQAVSAPVERGYLCLERDWNQGDTIDFVMDMPPRRVYASNRVRETVSKVCIMRGPLVYALEEADNGQNLHLVSLPRDAALTLTAAPFEGMCAISAIGKRAPLGSADELYSDLPPAAPQDAPLLFIPYFAWANRSVGEMRVFIAEQ